MNKMACLFAFAALLFAARLQSAPVEQAFLVQNSGWMEPFYVDPSSAFKPLVAAVARTVTEPGDALTVAAFNQSGPGNASPQLLYQGPDAGQVAPAIAGLGLAHKASGALADTDFREAILGTITGPFHARSGILWIFTNNRNSPGNDPDTAKRNREFYDLVHLDPSITRSLAFPLRMPVQGTHYRANGMMVYALAYGAPAAERLERMVADGTLGKVFTAAPARLKPLDRDAVRIVPSGVTNSVNVTASLAADGRTLVFDIGASDAVTRIGLKARLENLFYPYRIESARLKAGLATGQGPLAATVTPATIHGLAPGEQVDVALDLPVPATQLPSPWSWAALRAMGREVVMPAAVTIGLDEQQLRIGERFTGRLAELFPGDPLSDVFVPPASVAASSVTVPVVFRVRYPLLPVVLMLAAIVLLVAALLLAAWWSRRTVRYEVMIDGSLRKVALKAFAAADLHDGNGARVGRIRRGWGAPTVAEVADGHQVSIGRR